MAAHLDHLTLTVTDLAAGARFYDAALGCLGLERVQELVDEEEEEPAVEAVAYGTGGRAVLWLVTGATPTGGVHLALRADTRSDVERFHAAALSAGGTSQAAPRRWPIFRVGEFNAIVRDPAGNLVEAVSDE